MERLANLYLISQIYETDAIGQGIPVETESGAIEVSVHGITRQEWSAAGQQNLQPLCMCKIADSAAYTGQKLARLEGCPGVPDGRYTIYRPFLTDDGGIEIYLREDAGSYE